MLKTPMVGSGSCRKRRLGHGWNRQVGTNGDENSTWRGSGQPGESFRGDREDAEVSEGERTTHRIHLAEASNRINQAGAWVGLDIVKDDTHPGAADFRIFSYAENFLREAPCGPG